MYYHRVRVVAGGCLLRRRLNMVGSCFYRGAATIFLTHHAISSNHHALPFCHVLAFINRCIGTITYSPNIVSISQPPSGRFTPSGRSTSLSQLYVTLSQAPASRPGAPYRPPQAAQAATTAAPASGAAAQPQTPGPKTGEPRPPLSTEERARRV